MANLFNTFKTNFFSAFMADAAVTGFLPFYAFTVRAATSSHLTSIWWPWERKDRKWKNMTDWWKVFKTRALSVLMADAASGMSLPFHALDAGAATSTSIGGAAPVTLTRALCRFTLRQGAQAIVNTQKERIG